MPVFSVIVPTYNYGHFIGRAIQSVLDQTFPDFELIIVDLFSIDDTARIVRGFADPRIRFYQARVGAGFIAALRNAGIQRAAGEYIAFLDADDLWFPEKLAAVERFFSADPRRDLVCHDEEWVYADGRKERIAYGPQQTFAQLLFQGNSLSTSAVTVRRETLFGSGLFSEKPEYTGVEDYELWLRVARQAKIDFLHMSLGQCVVHAGSISRRVEQMAQNTACVIRDQYALLPDTVGNRLRLRIRQAEILRQAARDLLKINENRSAAQAAWRAWQLNPVGLKIGYTLLRSGWRQIKMQRNLF
ncbi:MAG: glycosyltransferase [Candidatus Omnitrophica bacterium]|nr:glycosyltransferase [Candidatus Omnitrophota bacterium]